MNSVTKEEIGKLFRRGTKSAGKILSILRIYQQENIKDKENRPIPNPDYFEGIILPTTRQINNYVNNTLKPKVAPVEFNYSDLVKWIENRRAVPEDEDEAFVIDDEININDVVPKGKNLCLFIFSLFLTIYII